MRPFALIGVVLVLAGCGPAADTPKATTAGADWSGLLGPNGDFSSPETGILTTWPKAGLRKVWEARLGEGYAPPVVQNGRLFHFDRFDDKCTLTARAADTGKLLWKFEYDTDYQDSYGYEPGPRACPTADGDRVYCYGPEGMLHCVGAEKGNEVWKVDVRKAYHVHQNFFGVGSSPLVAGDLLIVAVGGSPEGKRPVDLREAKGNGTGIVAFDKLTGKEKYRLSNELSSYSSPMLVALHGQPTVLYYARGGLLGFDPATGKERFSFKWRAKIQESAIAANPAVAGDTILISESYENGAALLRVTKEFKIETVWSDLEAERKDKALLAHWCTPVADGKYAYGCSGRHEPEADVRCVEWATGKVMWTWPKTRRCTLTKIDGHLLCLSEDGTLTLLKANPDKLEKVAEWNEKDNDDLRPPCWAPPVMSHGLLYVRGKGKLACYELMKKE